MANPEHEAIVRAGAAAIDEWRALHPGDRLDLRAADLSGAALSGANLSGADLFRAILFRADLNGADLRGADLRGADLNGADLRGADLRGADLFRANLSGADLNRAKLAHCGVGLTVFGNTNLSGAGGLDVCDHIGPSVVDFATLSLSGRLPLPFLRGCGLPDRLIEYLPSLLNETFRYNSCFISYSTTDETFAKRLHADLQDAGVRCWFAPEDLKTGDKYDEVFDRAIDVHDRTLLILSGHSVESDWVAKEVRRALKKERLQKRTVLFPIRIDDAVKDVEYGWASDIRLSRHIRDFTEWQSPEEYQVALDRLLRDLKAEDAPVAAPAAEDNP